MSLPVLQTPVYELNIPSTNETIKYRPFLVKEYKVLLTMIEASNDEISRIIKEVISTCTFNKLNTKDLTHFDIEYIFLMLRSRSIGEIVEVQVTCDCGNKIPTKYNIDDVKIVKDPEHTNMIDLNNDYGIEMMYPKIEDVFNVYGNKKTKVVDGIINLICNNIKGIYKKDGSSYWGGEDITKKEKEEFVLSLNQNQFKKLELFFKSSPRVVQEIHVQCGVCNKPINKKIEGIGNFFV